MARMYRYTESGLANVWLANGYSMRDSAHGRGVSIEDVEGLHRAIGQTLLRRRRLTRAEIRFLRKELGCSQKELAEILGTSEQTVSLWERDRGDIPAAADRLLRLLYVEHVQGRVQVRKLAERLAGAQGKRRPQSARRVTFEKRRSWREVVRP